MDEFVAETISPGALHRTARWLHPTARAHPSVNPPVTLQAPDTAASAPALQTGPSARSFIPTVQIYLINYIMVVRHPGKGGAVNNPSWQFYFSFHGPLKAIIPWCSSPAGLEKLSRGGFQRRGFQASMLLAPTLAREKGTFRGTCQQKEGGLIFLRAG